MFLFSSFFHFNQCKRVQLFVNLLFHLSRKTGLRADDSSSINPIEQIKNRKDVKKSLVIKTHLPFKLLPKKITSEVKKPKVIDYFFSYIKTIIFFSLDNLHSTQRQRQLRISLSLPEICL
jgi:hypothetical protein